MRPQTILVTGATGFVGRALTRSLIADGYKVVAIVRREDPELRNHGVKLIQGEIGDEFLSRAAEFGEIDTCFHIAAKVAMWGDFNEFHRVNVIGTEMLLALCKGCKVRNFIYTSSPSVIADGSDLCGVNETVQYPEHFEGNYPATKAKAEQMVLSAHQAGVFNTVALRPHLIFGPGDTNLIPTIVKRARAGKLVQIGDGKNLSDFTYIEDCVAAHRCALDALERNPQVGGKPYFISQGEPYNLWGFINSVLTYSGIPPVKRVIPRWLANFVAACAESLSKLKGPGKEPFLTRFLVGEMSTSHYFDISAARQCLGYQPHWTIDAALKRTFEPIT